jgi:hypothetical protein
MCKYDELIPYLGITKREYIMSPTEYEIKILRKRIDNSINEHIKKSRKLSNKELDSMYNDVMKAKDDFVKNENVWSRFGTFAERAEIAIHGYERLRDALMEEKNYRKGN